MPVRYGRFEMPKTLVKDEASATDTYAKFVAEPFEAGYGHTVGNSLRRVLLSSLEGAAITAVKINGAQHECGTLPDVVEDVTDIVLNVKSVIVKNHSESPKVAHIEKKYDVKLGESTKDGRFVFKAEEECLAACAGAPMMMVDHVYHEDLTVEKVDQILGALK